MFKTRLLICLAIVVTIYIQFKFIQISIQSHNEGSGTNEVRHQGVDKVLLNALRVSSKMTLNSRVTAPPVAYSTMFGNLRKNFKKYHSSSSRTFDDFGIRHMSAEEPSMTTRLKQQTEKTLPPYKLFNQRIGIGGKLYQDKFADDIWNLERSLLESNIVAVKIPTSGTQLKWECILENGNHVLVKPIRSRRDFMTGRDWIGDIERHTSEIAAYHLDRIIGFNRAPVTIGRTINITGEFRDLVKDEAFLNTFSIQNDEYCFYGVCQGPFCKPSKLICAVNGSLEISMTTYVFKPWHEEVNPWTFNPDRIKIWENRNICDEVLLNEFKSEEQALLNLIDSSILDFLLRNYDRHAYAYFADLGTSAMFLHYDHGKSFGNFTDDDVRILAPLTQCQRISNQTWTQLSHLASNRKLGALMKASLRRDSLNNILSDGHFEALDRRLDTIMLISKYYRKVDNGNM